VVSQQRADAIDKGGDDKGGDFFGAGHFISPNHTKYFRVASDRPPGFSRFQFGYLGRVICMG
jgi:hypothetical protein